MVLFVGILSPFAFADEETPDDERGYINFYLDINKNRPAGFNDYSYNLVMYPADGNVSETNVWNMTFTLGPNNNYMLRLRLPYGTYNIFDVYAIGDWWGRYMVDFPDSITIDAENPEFTYEFTFTNIDIVTNTEIETEDIEPINIPKVEKKDSTIILIAGIGMILLSVIMLFCIIILASSRKRQE